MLLAVSLGALLLLWHLVLMAPLREEGQRIRAARQKVVEQIRAFERQGRAIQEAHETDPNRELRQRAAELERQIEVLDGRIRDRTVSMISPSEMARFLEELLGKEGSLSLVRLENLPPEPVLGEAGEKNEAKQGPFKHGFEVEFRGRYLSTLRYLRALEALPWKFFWDALDYEVLDYPEAKVTIRAYTLGAEEGWVGV